MIHFVFFVKKGREKKPKIEMTLTFRGSFRHTVNTSNVRRPRQRESSFLTKGMGSVRPKNTKKWFLVTLVAK